MSVCKAVPITSLQPDVPIVAVHDQPHLPASHSVVVQIGKGPLNSLQRRKFVSGDQQDLIGHLRLAQVPIPVYAACVQHHELIGSASVFDNAAGIRNFTDAFRHHLWGE